MKHLFFILLISHLANSQSKTLYENGDSSVYLVEFNDTLSYLSFIEPAYSTFLFIDSSFIHLFDDHREPIRSYVLLKKEVRNDSIIYTECKEKFFVNKELSYYQYEHGTKNEVYLMVEGKYHLFDSYLSNFDDSLYVKVNDEIYIGDLNTSIYSVDILRPKKKKSEVQVNTASNSVDFTIEVPIKKKTSGVLIRYEILASTSYGYIFEAYVMNNISIEDYTENGLPVRFDFYKWFIPTVLTVDDE